VRCSFLKICIVTLCFSWAFSSVAIAAPFSSIVIDATSGRTLQQYRASQSRYPASLTKLMSLYIMFEEIEAGHLTPKTPIYISRQAARQPASRLGLPFGKTIPAEIAMKALLVKSANDVATAIAEHISGSEAKFARRMTKKARELGLYDTNFTNASGLYHWRQQSSARDMAKLAQALLTRFPQFESLWQTTSFTFEEKQYRSHNRVLRRLSGAMGMKTGYIRASGYNIATAVQRDNKRIILVIMGGTSAASRDRHAISLADRSLGRAQTFVAKTKTNSAKLRQAALWLDTPAQELAKPTRGLVLADMPRDWKIQVGAFSASVHADSQLQRIRRVLGAKLDDSEGLTEQIERNGKPMYRARFANLSEPQAFHLCRSLLKVTPSCLPIAP
jgi:D-alanyl-D-alanine carboxypeptidase